MKGYKFDKSRCASCMYRGRMQSIDSVNVYCAYAAITGETCLHMEGKQVVDRRGTDYSNCSLYQSGESALSNSSQYNRNQVFQIANQG